MKHLSEEELVLFYYGEAKEPQTVEAHLAECSLCRRQDQELRNLLNGVELPVPELAEDYAQQLWQRLRFRIAAERKSPVKSWQPLLMFAATAAVFLAAFLIGRLVPAPKIDSTQVQNRIFSAGIMDHLERLQMYFLDWSNVDDPSELDAEAQKLWARQLADDNRIYRQVAHQSGNTAIVQLLDDMELVLLEMVNGEAADADARVLKVWRDGEHTEIMLKIRLMNKELEKSSPQPPLHNI